MRGVSVAGGREVFERILGSLEAVVAGGDAREDISVLDRGLSGIARASRRGSIVVLVSDLLDLPEGAEERVAAIASRGRILIVVQVLDPDEIDLPFGGTVRLRALEGGMVVETDVETARASYVDRLTSLTAGWERALTARGARLVRAVTSADPVRVVREIVRAAR
jgi:hypothetical protein